MTPRPEKSTSGAFAIGTPNGIEEARFHRIGGIEQWIQMRGEDRDNPVVLVLHGGPGCSYRGMLHEFRPWERHFTIAHWDQRGAGKTFGRNGRDGCAPLAIERMATDAIEVAERLREQLGKPRVILLAHSWGTVLGLLSVARRPDLFHAYVGSGQVVQGARNELLSHRLTLQRARERGHRKAVRALERIGEPAYLDRAAAAVRSKWAAYEEGLETRSPITSTWSLLTALLRAPNYSPRDVYDHFAAMRYSVAQLFAEQRAFDAAALGVRFEVPMLFIQGDRDLQTVTALVEEHFASIEAPRKELVVIEGAGHAAILSHSDRFLKELAARAIG